MTHPKTNAFLSLKVELQPTPPRNTTVEEVIRTLIAMTRPFDLNSAGDLASETRVRLVADAILGALTTESHLPFSSIPVTPEQLKMMESIVEDLEKLHRTVIAPSTSWENTAVARAMIDRISRIETCGDNISYLAKAMWSHVYNS